MNVFLLSPFIYRLLIKNLLFYDLSFILNFYLNNKNKIYIYNKFNIKLKY